MPALTRRLAKLETTISRLGGCGRCRLCHGYPFATIYVMYELDQHGFHKTGECFLKADEGDRLTDDLCCIECGRAADCGLQMTVIGIGPKPAIGRRVQLPNAE